MTAEEALTTTERAVERLALQLAELDFEPNWADHHLWENATPMQRADYIAWVAMSDGEPDLDCPACGKVGRHHARGERGTVCMTHNFGPS